MQLINPNIKVIKGFRRSMVYNALINTALFIPNDLADIIQGNKFTLSSLVKLYGEENKEVLISYLKFLNEKNILINGNKYLIPIKNEWKSPNAISSAIVEVGRNNIDIVIKAITQLSELGCKALEFRIYGKLHFLTLIKLCKKVNASNIGSINLFALFNSKADFHKYEKLVHQFLKISIIVCYNAPIDKTDFFFNGASSIQYSTKNNDLTKSCGVIRVNDFRYERFLESQAHNTCLNRKVTVTLNGDIKNCPSMRDTYGNINSKDLKIIILNQEFVQKWFLSKDKIKKCRDCEFRYFCYDCRAYLEDPTDDYSKPLKCGYNPYTNEWEDWSKNDLSKIGIDYYGLKEFITNGTA